jgi:hypothetical protein
MGGPRFRFLQQRLPESTSVLGKDEYTACIMELSSGQCQVMGAGQVTIRRRDQETIHPAGTVFGLTPLGRIESAAARRVVLTQSENSYRELLANWGAPLEEDREELAPVQPLVDLLVTTRSHLRDAKQWELADSIRDALSELGFILEDGEEETTWRRID